MIDLFRPYIPDDAIDAVVEVLRTRWIGQGPKVDEFEKEFEKLFNVRYAVAVNSGTSALETVYDLIGLGDGDEVISCPLTCTATNLPLLARKVKIIWADIEENTLCINPIDVRSKITKKTKAIIQIHLGGVKADVGKVHVPVISDAAQALGIFNGDYICNSFQAIKILTTGDGGMITLNNESDYKNAKLMRWFGINRERKAAQNWQCYKERQMTFDIEMIGFKRQMTDISAAMGIAGLKHYNETMKHLEKLFNLYKTRLSDIVGIKIIDGKVNVHWLMTLLVEKRDEFARVLFEKGVDTNLVQIRNDLFKIFGGQRQDLPILNSIEDKYISIPIGRHVSEDNVNYVCDCIESGWGI